MQPPSLLRSLTLSALLALAPAVAALAQSEAPGATVIPSKPAAETATPSPGAAVNSLPAATPTPTAAPAKKKRTPEEKKARKADRLRKYDTNKDGKIDDKERAAMRADKGLTPDGGGAKVSPTP